MQLSSVVPRFPCISPLGVRQLLQSMRSCEHPVGQYTTIRFKAAMGDRRHWLTEPLPKVVVMVQWYWSNAGGVQTSWYRPLDQLMAAPERHDSGHWASFLSCVGPSRESQCELLLRILSTYSVDILAYVENEDENVKRQARQVWTSGSEVVIWKKPHIDISEYA